MTTINGLWIGLASLGLCLPGFCGEPSLEARLTPLVKEHKGKVAIGIKHLRNAASYYLHADEPMPTASLIKLAVMIEVYQQAAEGKIQLSDLVMLRDPTLREHGAARLEELARQIADRNFRLFAERGQLHVINNEMHLQGTEPFLLFQEMLARTPIDPAHAFYLGYEFAKAVTALTLGKNYVQDQALRWGFLTQPERGEHPPNV